jgi:hypothetical protein
VGEKVGVDEDIVRRDESGIGLEEERRRLLGHLADKLLCLLLDFDGAGQLVLLPMCV